MIAKFSNDMLVVGKEKDEDIVWFRFRNTRPYIYLLEDIKNLILHNESVFECDTLSLIAEKRVLSFSNQSGVVTVFLNQADWVSLIDFLVA